MGGGPAGLYVAILLKKAMPKARIEVYERNPNRSSSISNDAPTKD